MIIIIVGLIIFLYLYSVPYVHAYQAPKVPIILSPRQLVEKEFRNEPVMIRIAKAESEFNPLATNPKSSARGIFQILKGTWNDYGCLGDRFSPQDNIACARIIYDKDGTRPWDASKDKWDVVK